MGILKSVIGITWFLCLSLQAEAQRFQGKVVDKESKEALPYVDVFFLDLKTGNRTDENGLFTFEYKQQKRLHVQLSYIGYKSTELFIADTVYSLVIELEPSHFEIKEIVVSTPVGKLQRESVVNVAQRRLEDIQLSAPLTLAEALTNVAGVEQNTTGVGIGKPVIRGLSGSRIVTYAQGIRIENQQWGDEHGLGIGDIGIESVEIIKGPASLLYGSDALGGVLYFVDERFAAEQHLEVKAQSRFLSNTLGTSQNVGIKLNKNNLKFNLFSAYSSQADYQVPSRERVFNTRFDEKNVKAALGYNVRNWISSLRYSFLQNNYGIVEDAEFSKSTARTLNLPFQTIDNHALSFENKFFIKDATVNAIFGLSTNYRREFEDSKQEQELGMHLTTLTYNLKYTSPSILQYLNVVVGSQGMLQTNTNNGSRVLIPDATTEDVGLYGLVNLEYKKLHFQGGLRMDNRKIDTKTTQQIDVFRQDYQGLSFSGGAVYVDKKVKIRANVSNGFRAPNTSELLSNGVHEGTNRYEIGNRFLKNESATQVDLSLDYQGEHFQFSVNPFCNAIQNYIYLTPTDSMIDNNPVFNYKQTGAYLYGGEMGIHFHPHQIHWLHVESTFSTVLAEDTEGRNLPLIPQNKTNTTLSTEFTQKRKFGLSKAYIQHVYKFEQDRIGAFETISAPYNLMNAGFVFEIKTPSFPLVLDTGVKNIFNTQYIDHLSRFKNLGIQNTGFNFYLGLKVAFDKKLN